MTSLLVSEHEFTVVVTEFRYKHQSTLSCLGQSVVINTNPPFRACDYIRHDKILSQQAFQDTALSLLALGIIDEIPTGFSIILIS